MLLGAPGVARAQEALGEDPECAPHPSPVVQSEPNEEGGLLQRIEAGFAEIFAGQRLQIHVNASYENSTRQSELATSFRLYGEEARFVTHEEFSGGGHVDVGGSLSVWRRLGFGVSFTQMRNTGRAVVAGTVPHPLDVGSDRLVRAQTLGLAQRQRAVHASVFWRLPLQGALEMAVAAGPTYFSLQQGVVVQLIPVEVSGPPFSEVALRIGSGQHTRSGAGFNAGMDFTYMFTSAGSRPQLGFGYYARVSRGSVLLPISADRTLRRVSLGGVQTGAGLRLRF